MFKRKLIALNFENQHDFDFQNDEHLKYLVSWLEYNKIKHRKVEENTCLFNTKDPDWFKHFEKYLLDILCPYSSLSRSEILDWLLGLAIKLEYGDDLQRYQSIKLNYTMEQVPQHTNPLDNLDFDSEEFKNGVKNLANLLNIPLHPNHLIALEAVCKFVVKKFSPEALKLHQTQKSIISKSNILNLNDMELGMPCKDNQLACAAKILRLLFIQDLRQFQTQINEAIVASQNVTANPKTDQSLGKVGR